MVRTYGKLFVVKNWKKYLVIIILVCIQCRVFQNNIVSYEMITGNMYHPSICDYIVDFMKGTLPFNLTAEYVFNIPPIWSLYLIYFFVVIGRSVSQCQDSFERQLLLRCSFRKRWWMYQNLVIWMETAGYLAVTWFTFFVYGVCSGAELTGINLKLQMELNGLDLSDFGALKLTAAFVVMPLLIMLAAAYLQYVVSIAANAVIGIIIPVVLLISSVFYMNPLLLFNYLMLERDERLLAGGTHMWTGILVSLLVMAASYLAGRKMIEKKDLY